ncbi:putative transthyretin domain protein [Phaeomoniella chlamydospora]|uniref:5-hydroxyisourate hydrolase n=1 Tax=Phaeomoniella chlamydospora TaxID=158046 RepID=A0A0G2FUF0_PHACM|nr:putative transthyretin domain protein [Phaeomoniella chlamydospora]
MSSPITCHVLNTLNGTPAAGISATLTLISPLPSQEASAPSTASPLLAFTSTTNEDGRVKEWTPSTSRTLQDVISLYKDGEKTAWSIKFNVGEWYEKQGVEAFWPEVEVKFYVKKGERHYHVPVLVGPWTYTTYRGS